MRLRVQLVAVLLLVTGACAPTPEWEGTIEERDGVVYVHNPAEGLWEGRDPLPVRLELEQVFGVDQEPEEAILAFPVSVAVDGKGHVYVLDRQANCLVAFDPDGNVIWRVGRRGQGPGEFQSARSVSWDGDQRLYVSNQSSTRIEVFDLEGNHLKSQQLAELDVLDGRFSGFLDPDTLVLWGTEPGRIGSRVHVFDVGDSWRLKAEFFAEGGPDYADQWGTAYVSASIGEGRIRTGHRIEYLLREFNSAGKIKRVITRDFRRLIPPVTTLDGFAWSFGAFEAPMMLPEGYRLVPVYWATSVESAEDFLAILERQRAEVSHLRPYDGLVEFESAFDFLDKEGRYLGSLRWLGYFPETGDVDEIGPDGRLYTWWSEPFPQVRRYRVVIEE